MAAFSCKQSPFNHQYGPKDDLLHCHYPFFTGSSEYISWYFKTDDLEETKAIQGK